jgi:hypothetical protein
MESDPSKSVRLYAFRVMSTVEWPALAPRLKELVTEEHFAARPLWEREKYVRLLGTTGGSAIAPLFESWIPSKRWLWQAKDLEMLELALSGLGCAGEAGFEKVREWAGERGKPGEVARRVLESISRSESADGTLARRIPTAEKR